MLFSGGACSRRVSLFKAVLFSAKMRKARERERERVGSWERAGEFCRRRCFVLCGMPREGGKRQKKNLFDFKSRQTNKTNKRCMVKKHNKKKGGKEAESARASRGVHVMFCAV